MVAESADKEDASLAPTTVPEQFGIRQYSPRVVDPRGSGQIRNGCLVQHLATVDLFGFGRTAAAAGRHLDRARRDLKGLVDWRRGGRLGTFVLGIQPGANIGRHIAHLATPNGDAAWEGPPQARRL